MTKHYALLEFRIYYLAIIDLSKAHTPEGRADLAPQLRDPLRTNGFVYAINHGYTQAQCDRAFDITDVPFTTVPPEEMRIYTANIEKVGYYIGYKARQYWARIFFPPLLLPPLGPDLLTQKVDTDNGILDQIEQYGLRTEIPPSPHIGLYVDIATNHRRAEEVEQMSKNVWLKGHTEVSSVTVLWNQPVGGYRSSPLTASGSGFYKPTIHRVVQPPEDQRAYDRLGSICFTIADDAVKLLPLVHSPVLQRVGIERRCPDDEAPLSGVWRNGRTMTTAVQS
ncbi:hypothetical protein BU15DRAFT_63296 [Melanogaster broomeanus]|nr:hypothetical protein BU15DRAFT_63296 [Melanogaster broomeanus]